MYDIQGWGYAMKKSVLFGLFVFVLGTVPLGAKDGGTVVPGAWLRDVKVPFHGDGGDGVAGIRIYFPKKYSPGSDFRTVIALHGYNLPSREWESESLIVQYAENYNIVVVCPEMGKTVYEYAYYPETTEKWGPMPGGQFVSSVLIPYLRSTYGLARSRSKTGMLGVSTGGRGALLVACKNPELIGAAAGLSGDYDPSSMPRDRILAAVYGPYKDFKDRWENDDNIMKLAVNLKDTPVYLWYAAKDTVVPPEQTTMFAMRLKQLQKQGGNYNVTMGKEPHGVHQWRYWRKAMPEAMAFFDKNLAR